MEHLDSEPAERRRASRHTVPGSEPVGLMAINSVRVVDISAGGVLLVSSRPAAVGSRGRLTLNLGGSPLATEVEIRRVDATPGKPEFRLGAMFLGISSSQQDAIERFARP